jgi:hypothetical protein
VAVLLGLKSIKGLSRLCNVLIRWDHETLRDLFVRKTFIDESDDLALPSREVGPPLRRLALSCRVAIRLKRAAATRGEHKVSPSVTLPIMATRSAK